MNEDRLLRELGHLAKEEERAEKSRLDERWDRLAAGTLTTEEEAELLALAETSPEAREAYEAFRPLGPEFQARMVEKIAAELPKPKPKPKKKESRDWLRWFRRPAGRIGGWVTAAAAAAAVIVRVLWPPLGPIPDYQMGDVTGGSSEMRGEQAEDFAPGDSIEVVLHPETEARLGRLEARLFLLRGRELRRLETRNTFDPGGAVKMAADLDPDLQPGEWTLWAVVGRPGDLPDPAELPALAGRDGARQRDWVAVSRNIRIRSRGP
jgi:hypothetical protein